MMIKTVALAAILSIFFINGFSQQNGFNPIIYVKETDDLTKIIRENFFIEVLPDKKKAFEGEAVTVTYQLFVALDMEGKITRSPSYAGFSVYELDGPGIDKFEIIQRGRQSFKVYPIKKVQLYGLLTGGQIIKPVEMESVIRFRLKNKEADEFLNGPYRDTLIRFTQKTDPITIQVLPLPKTSPAGFEGAVGEFALSSGLTRSSLPMQEADTLVVTVGGSGNWQAVSKPSVQWPVGLEPYEPQVIEKIDSQQVPLSGTKVFKFPFVGINEGDFTIPGLSFSYFNPESESYVELTTAPLPVHFSAMQKSRILDDENNEESVKDFTALFSKIAVVLFPLSGIVLFVFLVHYWRKKQKDDQP